MRLSIIPVDKAVYVGGVCFDQLSWDGTPPGVHALQWYDVEGWIEYDGDILNEPITSLPDWAMNAYQAWIVRSQNPPPIPTQQEQNKMMAVQLLSETDWAVLPSVSNPSMSNPYLSNPEDFLAYRNAVRPYAIDPPDTEVNWPTRPDAVWKNA